MRLRVSPGSPVGLVATGEMMLIRRNRETREVVGVARSENNFTAAGLQEIARRLVGEGTIWDAAGLHLQVNYADGTADILTSGTRSVEVEAAVNGQFLVVSIEDARGTAYVIDDTHGLRPRTSDGRTLASYTDFSSGWNRGKKLAQEDWEYRWIVSVGGVAQPSSNVTWDDNVARSMARRLVGTLADPPEVLPTASAGSVLDTTTVFDDPIALGHLGEMGASDTVLGAVATIKRHRPSGSRYTCTGERIRFDADNGFCTIYPRAGIETPANRVLNFMHIITMEAAAAATVTLPDAPPGAPGLAVVSSAANITATVTAPEAGAVPAYYEVQVSTSSSFETVQATHVLEAAGDLVLSDLSGTFYFRARAGNILGESDWTAIVGPRSRISFEMQLGPGQFIADGLSVRYEPTSGNEIPVALIDPAENTATAYLTRIQIHAGRREVELHIRSAPSGGVAVDLLPAWEASSVALRVTHTRLNSNTYSASFPGPTYSGNRTTDTTAPYRYGFDGSNTAAINLVNNSWQDGTGKLVFSMYS